MDNNEYVDYLKDQADAAEADYHAQAESEQRDREEIARLNAKVAELEAALAEAREDSARLDWCSKHGAMAVEWWQGGYRVVTHNNVWITDGYDTPRAAIDAARKGKL